MMGILKENKIDRKAGIGFARTVFSRASERRFFFYLTLVVLFFGLLGKMGIW